MHPYQDDSLLIGWTYKTESLPATSDRAELTLPAPVVRDAIDMLNTVADSDGDVRGLLDAVEGVRSALRKARTGYARGGQCALIEGRIARSAA